MQQSLIFLGQFQDEDIDWFINHGQKRVVEPGEELIRLGKQLKAMFLVLDGQLQVFSGGAKPEEIAKATVGDVLGEVSFVDSRPPLASVVAEYRSVVLAVPRPDLHFHLEQNAGFAARFYRAMAMFLADRLRQANVRLSSNGDDLESTDTQELSAEMLDNLHLAGNNFDRIRRILNVD